MSGKMASMSLTAKVEDEPARLHVERPCCRRAELSATFRFAGGLQIVSPQVIDHRIVVEAELDSGIAARRVRKYIMEMYGHRSEMLVLQRGGLRRGPSYVMRVVREEIGRAS